MPTSTHHTAASIMEALDRAPLDGARYRTVEITLAPGHSAWHPASTKKVLRAGRSKEGDAVVEYEQAPDGGITARVIDGMIFESEQAALVATGYGIDPTDGSSTVERAQRP